MIEDLILFVMEFGFATDGTNNAFFDRILQTRVEVDLQEIKYCLEHCKIAQQPYKIGLELSERLCLGMNKVS